MFAGVLGVSCGGRGECVGVRGCSWVLVGGSWMCMGVRGCSWGVRVMFAGVCGLFADVRGRSFGVRAGSCGFRRVSRAVLGWYRMLLCVSLRFRDFR